MRGLRRERRAGDGRAITLVALSLAGLCRSAAAAGKLSVGECRRHDDCRAEQFCAESVCSAHGFDALPCTRCADCLACTPFVAVDRSCPLRCPTPDDQIQYLQGVFTQLDGDGCVSVWLFELDTFRRYQTGVQHTAAISYSVTGSGRCDRTRNLTQIVTGHFQLRGTSLQVWIPSEISISSYDELSASVSLIPRGLRITWSSGDVDELVQYNPARDTGARGEPASVLPAGRLAGTVSMYDTECNMVLHLFEVMSDDAAKGPASPGIDGGKLYLWRAVTFDCAIGPKNLPPPAGEDDDARRRGGARALDGDGTGRPAHLVNASRRDGARRAYVGRSIDQDLGSEFELSRPANDGDASCPGGCAAHSQCWIASNLNNRTIEKLLCWCDEHYHRVERQDANGRKECQEDDACLDGTHNCHQYADCESAEGSFSCTCQTGFFDRGYGTECEDVDECLQAPCTGCNERCENTPGSFQCSCEDGFARIGEGTACVSQSEIVIEKGWYHGLRIAFTFSWKMESPAHPRDIIMVGKELEDGSNRQIFWMFISAATAGCSSHMQVAVGYEHVMECHIPTDDYVVWGSFSIHQESAGWGTYYARMYSHNLSKIVAEHTFAATEALMPGLAADSEFAMDGGPILCAPRPGPCPPSLGPFCDIEIPSFAGYVETTMPLRCGDGRVASPDEQCDDGNSENSDGCDASCMIEAKGKCFYTFNPEYQFDQQTGLFSVSPPDSTCIVFRCGDGARNLDTEQCDDGNEIEMDGCGRNCTQAVGYSCARNLTNQQVPGSERWDPMLGEYVRDYQIVDMGEVCTPFVVPLRVDGIDPPGCPDCHENGECVLFEYSKQCMCSTGFVSDNLDYLNVLRNAAYLNDNEHICIDLDECERERRIFQAIEARNESSEQLRRLCPPLSECVNTFGSFECICNDGLNRISLDGGLYTCVDLDECTGTAHTCTPPEIGGFCQNTFGSFECGCRTGYRGTGIYQGGACEQIDECVENSHTCTVSQFCLDAQGSFNCYCPNARPRFFEGECFSDTFFEDNYALFQDWGRDKVSHAVQGLVRFWHVPDAGLSNTGIARWWTLKAQSPPGVHNSVYFVHREEKNSGENTTSPGNNGTLLEMSLDCPAEKIMTVSDAEGTVRVNSSKELGRNVFIWNFEPSESALVGKVMHIGFLSYNLIRMPESPLEEERLSFCRTEVKNGRICRTFNASHPPENPYSIELPFTIELLTADMRPETTAWKLFSLIRPEKFAFTYGLRAPVGLASKLTAISGVAPEKYLLGSKNALVEQFFGSEWQFSVKNKADGRVTPPCSIKRSSLIDDFSGFHVNPAPVESTTLDGFWKGSCNPRVPSSGNNCRVTFNVHGRVFELQISGCAGWGIPTLATGIITQDGVTRRLSNVLSGEEGSPYRQFNLHYASGIPARSSPGYTVASAAYKWTNVEIDEPNEIVININAPAMNTLWYPGDKFPYVAFDQQEYPCQVLRLRRMSEDDFREASKLQTFPTQLRLQQIDQDYENMQLYVDCRQQMQGLDAVLDGYPLCRDDLAPLLSANVSILSQSFLFSDICSVACLPLVVEAMKKSHAVCADRWQRFFAGAFDSPTKDSIRTRFEAIIVHIAEFLFRSSVSCTGNFYRRRCHDVLAFLSSKTTSPCTPRLYLQNAGRSIVMISALPLPQHRDAYFCLFVACSQEHVTDAGCQNSLEPFDDSSAVSALQFLQFDASKGAGCDMSCRLDLETFLLHGSCCLASIEEARKAWLDTVLPSNSNQILFDASEYLSTYGAGKPSLESDPSPVIIRRPHGTCPSSSEISLDCAFETCYLDQLWPASCCPAIECKNGFSGDYLGACFCRCTPPFAGVYCQLKKSQVNFAVRFTKTSYVVLDVEAVITKLAFDFGLGGTQNMEVAYIDLIKSASSRRAIPMGETLDMGIRILVDGTRESVRLMTLLTQAMEGGSLPAAVDSLDCGEMQDSFVVEPYAVSVDGSQVVCDDCQAKNETVVQQPTSDTSINVYLILTIALGSAFICILLAIFCRFCRGGSKDASARDCLSIFTKLLESAKAQALAREDRKRRMKDLKEYRGKVRDTQFAFSGIKPGEFVKKPDESSHESPQTVKISVNLSKSQASVSRSILSPRSAAGDSIYTPRRMVFSAKSRLQDVPDEGEDASLPLDLERSESDAVLATKVQIDNENADVKRHVFPRSNASLVASFGMGDDDDSRIDTIFLRQQRLSRKLEDLKSGKAAKKLNDRGSKNTSRATSPFSAPSVWSPRSQNEHLDLDNHSERSSILLSTIPHMRRIPQEDEAPGNGLRDAGTNVVRQKIWSPRKALSRNRLDMVNEVSADPDRTKSPRSTYTPSVHSASTHSQRHVLEFSALERAGNRIRQAQDNVPTVSMESSMMYVGGDVTPRSIPSHYEQLGSTRYGRTQGTPRSVASDSSSSGTSEELKDALNLRATLNTTPRLQTGSFVTKRHRDLFY